MQEKSQRGELFFSFIFVGEVLFDLNFNTPVKPVFRNWIDFTTKQFLALTDLEDSTAA